MKICAPFTAKDLSLAFLTIVGADFTMDLGVIILPLLVPTVENCRSYPETTPGVFSRERQSCIVLCVFLMNKVEALVISPNS